MKYQLLNELTQEILRTSDSLEELEEFALKEFKKKRNQSFVLKESSKDEVIKQFGILCD